jgi:hypothetical protein
MKAWTVALALAGTMASGMAMAEDQTGTGNELLVQCQNAIEGMNSGQYKHPMDVGICFGTVSAVMSMALFYNSSVTNDIRICLPNNVNTGQATRIVVKYLQDRPELLNRDRSVLTWMALDNSYPCK